VCTPERSQLKEIFPKLVKDRSSNEFRGVRGEEGGCPARRKISVNGGGRKGVNSERSRNGILRSKTLGDLAIEEEGH